MESVSGRITIEFEVFDRVDLFRAALRKALEDGVEVADYLSMRRQHADRRSADIIMLLDPGASPPGVSIQNSYAEVD